MASPTSTLKFVFVLTLTLLIQVRFSQTSLTVVVDTTESMREELDVIKREMGSVLNVLYENSLSTAGNFILVPFNYPDVLSTFTTTDPVQFIRAISRLSASGGHDCPENSLAGIQKALENSQPESQIYVFTDAYARDTSNVERIWELCARTRSQVTIFLSGSCVPVGLEQAGDVAVFNDIAAACSGILFHFETSNLRQAFSFMKRMVIEDVTEMSVERTITNSNREVNLSVSPYTSILMLAAVGDYPSLDINETDGVERIIHTRHASVVRITSPKSHTYKIGIRNRGKATLTTYSKKYFPFNYGFSTMKPSVMEETSRRPMPGRSNYFLIGVPVNQDLTLSSIEVSTENMNDTTKLTLEETSQDSNVYLAKENHYPQTPFKITVYGKNRATFDDFNLTSTSIEHQKSVKEPEWTEPTVDNLSKEITAEFGTNIVLKCKVYGYPVPTVWWSGEGVPSAETNLLEIPALHISRVTLENVTVNATYHCHAKNAKGEHSGRVDVFVHRDFVFEVLQKPQDKQIEYGTEDKLYCEVNAYPEASIKWTYNDTSIDFNLNIEVLPEENALKIKNMSMDDVGTYSCEISNSEQREKYSAVVTISGVDPPRIDKTTSEVNLKNGVNSNLECRILEGKPSPKVTWRFLPDEESDFTSVPSDIYVKDGKLQFVDVKKEYRGVYRCEASNVAGSDHWDLTAKVLYAPILKDNAAEVTVREGDVVELPCEAEADPPAKIRWELTHNDVTKALDDRHTENELHTLRFNALWNDFGVFHCIAENEVGKSEKTVKVTVLVAPYISPPAHNAIAARIGSAVTFKCQVLYGDPAPSTVWEFQREADSTTVLKRGSMTNTLQLRNVTLAHQGSYYCKATNQVSSDSIKITLTVQ